MPPPVKSLIPPGTGYHGHRQPDDPDRRSGLLEPALTPANPHVGHPRQPRTGPRRSSSTAWHQ
jgi:hypothetical protein